MTKQDHRVDKDKGRRDVVKGSDAEAFRLSKESSAIPAHSNQPPYCYYLQGPPETEVQP